MVYSKELPTSSQYIDLDMSKLEGKGNFFYQIRAGEKVFQGKVVRVK